MPKYIDFDIAIRKLGTWYNDLVGIYGSDEDFVKGYGEAMDNLADVPTADVQEVKHAKWVHYGEYVQCSNCEHVTDDFCYDDEMTMVLPYYCSNCGAKIDLEDDK